MEQHKAKFEVGDIVRVVNVDGAMRPFLNREGVIRRIDLPLPFPYIVNFTNEETVFSENEISHSKEHKVLTILREYEKRKNTNLSGQESRG